MKPGTLVYAARVTEAGVEVDCARFLRTECFGEGRIVFDRPLLGWGRSTIARHVHLLHATRTAALEALAERLEEEGKRERKTAAEHITRAERCFINAERARRMAEGKP